jgi:MFS family permease
VTTNALAWFSARAFSSLRTHRNYRLFFVGQTISVCGTWMGDTALPWLIIERTHSPVAVGLLIFCRYMPFAIFSLHAGVLADRYDNRRMMMVTQSAQLLVAAVLAVLTLSHLEPLWSIYLLATLSGVAVIFDAPTRNALVFQLVGREDLSNAVALNSGLNSAARAVGPAVAGVVIAVVGVGACFVLNSLLLLAVLTVLLLMRPDELFRVDRVAQLGNSFAAIREGAAYVRSDPLLRLVIALTAAVSIVGFNFRTLLPVLASKTLEVGPGVFGFLYACFGIGALVGALLSALVRSLGLTALLVGVNVFSVSLLLIAPLHVVWLIAPLLVGVGVGFSLWVSASQSIIQLAVPNQLRGRVLSLWIAAFAGLTPVGSLLSGWLAAVGGTVLAFSIAGGVGLVATVGVAARRRHLLKPDLSRNAPSVADAVEV